MMQDESDAISALTGFSLDHVLSGLSLPSGSGLSNQLGISGLPSLSSNQIYSEKWDEDGAVGAGEGEDYEDEVDREIEEEEDEVTPVKQEVVSPLTNLLKERRVRIVKRLVERPKSVYERFPSFDKDKILDFTELLKGYAVKKPRVVKRPLHCMPHSPYGSWRRRHYQIMPDHVLQLNPSTPGGRIFQEVSWRRSSGTLRGGLRVRG